MRKRLEIIKSFDRSKTAEAKRRLLTFVGDVKKAEAAAEGEAQGKFFVEGYASSGVTDTYGDRISDAALQQLADLLPTCILLHNHDADQQLGIVREAKFDAEKHAVWVSAEVMDEVAQQKITDGRLNAFSIRAYASDWSVHETADEHWVEITAWERVIELSLTSVPVQAEAKVTGWVVKSLSESPDVETRLRRLELKASMPAIKADAAMVEFLTQVAAALRAITTEDSAAGEAIAAVATAVEEKAAAEQADLDEESGEETSAADTTDAAGGQKADPPPEPPAPPTVTKEEFTAALARIDAVEAELKKVQEALAASKADAETAKAETEKALAAVKAVERRLEVVAAAGGDNNGTDAGDEPESALAGCIFGRKKTAQ